MRFSCKRRNAGRKAASVKVLVSLSQFKLQIS
jgi:hypothetical protein